MLATVYLFASIGIAVTAWMHAGAAAGLSALGTSLLSLFAGGSLIESLKGKMGSRVWSPIFACLMLVAAWYISFGFTVHLFGYHLTGLVWGIIGFAAGCSFSLMNGTRSNEL